MDNLIIFRLFISFPLIGLLIPDLGSLLSNTKGYVPASHLITEVTLITCVMVCSVGIMYFKRKLNGIVLNNDTAAIA
jgi:hypothetical protein